MTGELLQSLSTSEDGTLTIITQSNVKLELSAGAALMLANHLLKSLPLKFGPKTSDYPGHKSSVAVP